MNLKCLICSDLFTPYSEIHATQCGHLFHYQCLTQWLERSRTCPQCRCSTTSKTIHKIYLSVEENAEATDLGTLQNKLDNVQFEISVKENLIKKSEEKCSTLTNQNAGLKEEVKELEKKVRVLDSAMYALKEQIIFFKTKAKDKERVEEEINSLKKKLKDLEYINVVVNGSREEVNDMLRSNPDPHSLSILVCTLKKELLDYDKKRKHVHGMLRDAQNQSASYKIELAQLNRQNNKMQKEIEAHKQCESEKEYLKSKIHQLSSKKDVDNLNTSIRRIITESPAPLANIMQIRDEHKNKDSPSVPEKVQEIKDSDSPYLRVQSSSVGLSGLINYNTKFITRPSSSKQTVNNSSNNSNNKFTTIFKQPSFKLDSKLGGSSFQTSYDGMGGHSRNEEFPTPQQNKAPLKRARSTSTITSAKFRRLGPPPQKKLSDFLMSSPNDD